MLHHNNPAVACISIPLLPLLLASFAPSIGGFKCPAESSRRIRGRSLRFSGPKRSVREMRLAFRSRKPSAPRQPHCPVAHRDLQEPVPSARSRSHRLARWRPRRPSYGTRLALIALRDFYQGVRSVVLDSVVPPEADEYADGPSKFENALDALFKDCAADPSCNAAFPNLRAALMRAADQLDANPWRLAGEWQGIRYDVRLDGRTLLQALHMALYESDLIPFIPKASYKVFDRSDDSLWRRAVATETAISKRLVDMGAHFSYHCSEEIPFTDVPRMAREDRSRPWMRHILLGNGMVSACRFWLPETARARETLPVTSDVPVLLLAGQYDPVAPPSYAQSAASHLRNGHLFVFPGMGHWLTANTVNSCPQDLVLEFLDNPGRTRMRLCQATKSSLGPQLKALVW